MPQENQKQSNNCRTPLDNQQKNWKSYKTENDRRYSRRRQ